MCVKERSESMVIYRSVGVRIYAKMHHLRVNSARNIRHGVNRFAFIGDFGDLPVCRYHEITGKFEKVVNPRGRAYAARNRTRYRRENAPRLDDISVEDLNK
jgi:hypothetical protein